MIWKAQRMKITFTIHNRTAKAPVPSINMLQKITLKTRPRSLLSGFFLNFSCLFLFGSLGFLVFVFRTFVISLLSSFSYSAACSLQQSLEVWPKKNKSKSLSWPKIPIPSGSYLCKMKKAQKKPKYSMKFFFPRGLFLASDTRMFLQGLTSTD